MRGGFSGPDQLNVTQAYTLVATGDVPGRHLGPQRFVNYGVAGAIFADLGIAGRIKVDLDRGDRVRVLSAEPTGDPVLDEVLQLVVDSPTQRSVGAWVMQLGSSALRTRVLDSLVDDGLLERRSSQVLGVVPAPRFREAGCRPEDDVVAAIRHALRGTERPDSVIACVIVLADGTRVLKKVVDEVPQDAVDRIVSDVETAEVVRKIARVIRVMRVAMSASATP
jgi:hypothetical protein